MSFNRPEPGASLNQGKPTVPRPAATVILLRGGEQALEVLLVQRSSSARVMAGAWVFPGGSVDSIDSEQSADAHAALLSAARRELREEAGIDLDADHELVPLLRWITPEQITYRYDTWFFAAPAPPDVEVNVDGVEIVDHRWISPSDALAARRAEELFLVFPTIRQLQQLERFASAQELLAHARSTPVTTVQPRVIGSGDDLRIVLPGEPGYTD